MTTESGGAPGSAYAVEAYPNTALRVLHVCETARGGVGTYVNTITSCSGEAIINRTILALEDRDMLAATASVRTFARTSRSLRALWHLVSAACSEQATFRPHIVFCHSTFALLPLLIMRLFSSKIKFLYCPHGWAGAREMEGVLRPTLLRRGEAWLSRWAHCVVNVSQTDFDYARKNNYGGQHVLIENAVVPAQRDVPLAVLKGSDTDIHLLFVGRFDHQKGLDILLKAFTDARRTRADLRLHVIGAPVAGSGGAYNNSMHIEGVDFLGWVGADKIDGYYRAADVVVLPSRWEGLPLVLPEALRNGTPVLVSDRSGLPHLIDEGRSGFSVVLDVASVSNAISALSKDSLIAMRPAAINLFNQRYNASRLCAEICELYFEVADNMNQ